MARKLRSLGILGSAAVVVATAGAALAVPPYLSEQGRLFDNMGMPVANGTVSITFRIYAAATGGAALWTEAQMIATDDGYFSAVLGDTSNGGTALPPTLFNGSVRYLGVAVGTDNEMTPRQPLVSVPYALVARGVVDEDGDVIINSQGQWLGSPTGLVGPTGPAGPAGGVGAVGPTGPAGAAGGKGATGPTGPNGSPGGPGGQGPTGPQGNPGTAGGQGPTGPQGTPGSPGGQGPTGPTGLIASSQATGIASNSAADAAIYWGFGSSLAVAAGNSVRVTGVGRLQGVPPAGSFTRGYVFTCYRQAAGTPTAGHQIFFFKGDGGYGTEYDMFAVDNTFTFAAAGTYEFGVCTQKSTGTDANFSVQMGHSTAVRF